MKNALILHGKPPQERYERALIDPDEPMPHEANWLPWLGRQLGDRGIEVDIPALPKPYFPVYEDWERAAFQRITIGMGTGVVAHSASVDFILRHFSEHKEAVAEQLVFVAPYHDYKGNYGDFSQYELDRGLVERVGKLTIVYSSDDHEPIIRRSEELIDLFPSADPHKLEGFGHFRIDHNMTSEELPELLALMDVQ